jgi:hypothetical protein
MISQLVEISKPAQDNSGVKRPSKAGHHNPAQATSDQIRLLRDGTGLHRYLRSRWVSNGKIKESGSPINGMA